jgi:hypothetical protein
MSIGDERPALMFMLKETAPHSFLSLIKALLMNQVL